MNVCTTTFQIPYESIVSTRISVRYRVRSTRNDVKCSCVVLCLINAFRAAGECRRQFKNVTNFVKNVKIVEFHDHIWNHHEKCFQISTNMPSIGLFLK